jgi:hypothetical protein
MDWKPLCIKIRRVNPARRIHPLIQDNNWKS